MRLAILGSVVGCIIESARAPERQSARAHRCVLVALTAPSSPNSSSHRSSRGPSERRPPRFRLARGWRAVPCALAVILALGACGGGGGGGGGTPPGLPGSEGAGKLRLLAATMQGTTLTMTFNKRLDPNSEPWTTRFIIRFTNSVKDSLRATDTRVDGKTIVATMNSAVDETDEMELDYNSDDCTTASPCIQDLAGNVAPLIEVWRVTYGPPPADGGPYPSPGRGIQGGGGPSGSTARMHRLASRTLAEVGRRTMTGALDNIGTRFAASVPSSGLTLAGRPVSFGAASGNGVEAAELLRGSAFSLTLGAPEGSGMPSSPLWSVWGRGDFGSFAGRPEPGTRYEGELRTGWLGIDARAGPWVAGLAVSHGTGEADYGFEDGGVSGRGRSETTLTALYPYGRWTLSDGLELSGVLGAGRGEALHRLDGDEPETSGLSMRMGSVGLRHEFPRLAEIRLAARADASLVRMETGDGPDYADGISADSWRLRAGVEASRRFALDEDEALAPFTELAARRDGGDGLAGTGFEVAGGLRYTAPGVHVEARGRWLAAHSEEGAEERGVSVTARMGPGAHGRGLLFALSPRWGASEGSGALWRDELPRPSGATGGAAAAVNARIGYGRGLAPYGLLTPFAETGLSGGDSRRLRLGARFEASRGALGAEIAGERVESGAAEPGHTLRLGLELRF